MWDVAGGKLIYPCYVTLIYNRERVKKVLFCAMLVRTLLVFFSYLKIYFLRLQS
ncbi:hypothetical protein HBA_0385 [Sodalis endosymbiont of Henestaris halophilus]|nr:hypothetical protein HBA_0385 [Sodalis endosymbiont of Henestaris halophilus]